jgi:hypothetical protein
MINDRDDWLSPAAFVAGVDFEAKSEPNAMVKAQMATVVNVYGGSSLNQDREAFRETLADLGHGEATVFGHWALMAYDKVHHPKLYDDAKGDTIEQPARRHVTASEIIRDSLARNRLMADALQSSDRKVGSILRIQIPSDYTYCDGPALKMENPK